MHVHRLLTLSATLVLTLLLSACGLVGGDDRETYEPSIGSNERTETTDALGFAIVVDGEGNGRVVGTLLNTTDVEQRLVGASVRTEREPAIAQIDERLTLPPGAPVRLAREAAVAVSAEELPVGLFVELTLDIEGGAPLEMLVPVEPQEGPYAGIEVTAPPDGDVSP